MGLIRVLLALAVVLEHSRALWGLEWTRLVQGRNAVEMFYTISGFYMALILTKKYTGRGSFRIFIQSRFFRIYPAYVVVCFATCFAGAVAYALTGRLIPLFRHWSEYGPGMTYETKAYLGIANIVLIGQDSGMFLWIPTQSGMVSWIGAHYQQPMCQRFMVVAQAWTIGTELWFYLLAPFLVQRLRSILAILAVAVLLRLAMIHLLGLKTAPWSYCFFPTELPFFLSGALAFKAFDALKDRLTLLRSLGQVAFFGTLVLILAYDKIPWQWFPYTDLLLRIDPITVLFPVALPFIFAYTMTSRVDRLIGELSYPIYLTHWIVIDLLRTLDSPWVGQYLGELATILTLVASIVLWFGVDRPIDAWRQRRIRAQKESQVGRPLILHAVGKSLGR